MAQRDRKEIATRQQFTALHAMVPSVVRLSLATVNCAVGGVPTATMATITVNVRHWNKIRGEIVPPARLQMNHTSVQCVSALCAMCVSCVLMPQSL